MGTKFKFTDTEGSLIPEMGIRSLNLRHGEPGSSSQLPVYGTSLGESTYTGGTVFASSFIESDNSNIETVSLKSEWSLKDTGTGGIIVGSVSPTSIQLYSNHNFWIWFGTPQIRVGTDGPHIDLNFGVKYTTVEYLGGLTRVTETVSGSLIGEFTGQRSMFWPANQLAYLGATSCMHIHSLNLTTTSDLGRLRVLVNPDAPTLNKRWKFANNREKDD